MKRITSRQLIAAAIGCLAILASEVARAADLGQLAAADEEDAGEWQRVPSTTSSAPTRGAAGSAESASPNAPPWAAGHPQRGRDDAPVTIVEFTDFQCPYCRKAEATLDQVLAAYGENVRLIHMDFPLPHHSGAFGAAIAARCADEQGKFWPYHDALLASQSNFTAAGFKSLARELGLDPANFGRCLDSGRYAAEVESDRSVGERIGISGTPSFVINHKAIAGAASFAQFRAIIDAELTHSRR
jgi:protein-disulfide isomerase